MPDPAARGGGRGAYICRTPACLERATRRGGLSRALRRPVRVAPDLLVGAADAPASTPIRVL